MRNAGVWAGALLLGFAGFIFWQSLSFDYYTVRGPGPGFLPLWLSGVLIVISLVYIWEAIKKEVIVFKQILPKGRALGNILSMLGSIIIFMIVISYAGFVVSAVILLFIVLVREFKWYSALGISVVTSIIVFLVFNSLLGIPLPVNALGW
ncbi:tripartite tricarboxylate transporter TctB family protein [Peribacillus cavernae]|uniref:tripartite tricarboxylate transporter TctB family protein n=1 Tax=Peribacillus cavernae TaxID=1674310 RepID=UPI00163CD827|nr:tripartite tricarboxylate transporter TctB family protein [Peribacillus cavernae]MDQ0218149.1 putative tricarboxylic transport membrane protein [Peribacillus cavernae]